jgi:enoyl-CoA hydratase/carnithine racemase
MPPIEHKMADDGIAVLTFNRPQARNALTWEAMQAFQVALEALRGTPGLRALILTGAQGAFCSGGDLVELHDYPTALDGARLAGLMGDTLAYLEALPVPTIAAIEGPALGGGAEIALACDLRVMADGATFGLMHVRLGIIPAWGGRQRLVGYARALELLTLGEVLNAQEAVSRGLANRHVDQGQALGEAPELARSIAARDADAVQAIKRFLRAGQTLPFEESLTAERAEFPPLWAAPAHLKASAGFLAGKNGRARDHVRS